MIPSKKHHSGLKRFYIQLTNFNSKLFSSAQRDNMALRASDSKTNFTGLPPYWQNAGEEKPQEWERWLELFEAALMAKSSISLDELTRDTSSRARRKELMGGFEEEVAQRKAVSLLYIAVGEAARKTLLDRNPNLDIKTISLKDLLKEANGAFLKKKNRLMDRHKFLNRKQQEGETLEQFWHSLNGLAANCDFGTQTQGLVYDIFVSNMRNTVVQERLFTEPRDNPDEALKYAIAFEQGVQQKRTICTKQPTVKEEPVAVVEKNAECYKCGETPFSVAHQKVCKAKSVECRKCGKTGHYARMCRSKTPVNKYPQQGKRRVNAVQKQNSWSSSGESEEEVEVLHIDDIVNSASKPFVLKGTFNRKAFHAIIDTGSPVTIFTEAHVNKLFGKAVNIQPLKSDER